ncbi:DUF2848 domain-containing protein [Oligella urethralis]|uniref:DUF2848 domain-containing protein n=1 Tax=Oligella urethralis TaxID=90245 RepID=UPI000D010623|nr:DUF2848 domain-containing protein [Oligella urethralis]AVL71359.1 DUF2848 domain-containing protein [Oligella urethralis]
MKLKFNLLNRNGNTEPIAVDVKYCVVAGWAGRDKAAIDEHIKELEELGVKAPSEVPLFYRVASNQLTQKKELQVVGNGSSGETEVLIFSYQGRDCISICSDHTDRILEAHSVALSKQICVKPTAKVAWLFEEVADHWDQLIIRSWIEESGQEVLYQDGSVNTLLNPVELVQKHFKQKKMPADTVMTCGTVTVIGNIRPSSTFKMQLIDPVLERTIEHSYIIEELPEVE